MRASREARDLDALGEIVMTHVPNSTAARRFLMEETDLETRPDMNDAAAHDDRPTSRKQAATRRTGSWQAFCQAMEESLDSEQTRQQFEEIRASSPLVAFSTDVHQLLGRIREPVVEAEYRDLLYRDLVQVAQGPGAASALARVILLLALSAALSGTARRNRQRSGTTACDSTSDVILAFDLVVRRLDLKKVEAIAPTLVKNTARTLEYDRSKLAAEKQRESPLPDDQNDSGVGSVAPIEPAIFGVRCASGVEDQINAAIEWMEPKIGRDNALLVACVVIEGETHAEVAERLGISEANARVRLHRALGILRKHVSDGGAQ